MEEFSKSELVDVVHEQLDGQATKKDVDFLLTLFLNEISNQLAEGNRVELKDFGSFYVSTIAARSYRNPRTGEPVEKGERKNVKFRAASKMKAVFKEAQQDLIG